MDSYFLRETDVEDVDPEDLRAVWEQDKVAIHYPGSGPVDLQSLNPGDYATRTERNAIRIFARLAREGGYIWSQCPGTDYEIVGKVAPRSRVEFVDARWARPRAAGPGRSPRAPGDPAVLKVLPLQRAKKVGPGDLIGLRSARPRKAGLSEWNACGNRLAAYVEERLLTIAWKELSRELQQTACAEYLRHHKHEELPRLKFLLMPVGRTLQDIDIYGLTEDQRPLYAQVAQGKPDFLEHMGKMRPLMDLRRRNKDAEIVMFADVPITQAREGIWVVPTAEVFEFLWSNPDFLHRLFLF